MEQICLCVPTQARVSFSVQVTHQVNALDPVTHFCVRALRTHDPFIVYTPCSKFRDHIYLFRNCVHFGNPCTNDFYGIDGFLWAFFFKGKQLESFSSRVQWFLPFFPEVQEGLVEIVARYGETDCTNLVQKKMN